MTATKPKPAAPAKTPATRTADPDDYETRLEWAAAHSARIAAMLEAPTTKEVPGRVFRCRYFLDGDYHVVSLVQNIRAAAPAPGQQAAKVVTFVNRGYHHANGQSATVLQSLFGEYHTDEIVAFLRLDLVDPETVTWHDDTHYSSIIVVSDVIGKHLH